MLLETKKLTFSLFMFFLSKTLTFAKKSFILSTIQQTNKRGVNGKRNC